MYVLATLPHAYCVTKVSRNCDTRVQEVNKILVKILKKFNFFYIN